MATWLTVDGEDLPFVPEMLDLLAAIEPPLEVAAAAADTAQSILSVFESLLSLADPNGALRALIDALIDDLITNSINVLLVKPQFLVGQRYQGGLGGFGRILQDALNDQGDLNRPNFKAGDESGGVVLMFSAPSFAELAPIIAAFQSLFLDGWKEFQAYVDSLPGELLPLSRVAATGFVSSIPAGTDPRSTFISEELVVAGNAYDFYSGLRVDGFTGLNTGNFSRVSSYDPATGTFVLDPPLPNDWAPGDAFILNTVAQSRPPDWYQARAIDIFPPIGQAAGLLSRVRDALSTNSDLAAATKALRALIDLLQAKVYLFQQILQQVQDLVDVLQNLGALTNLNVLAVPPQALGDEGFMQEYWSAANPPPIANNAVTAGVVLYGGSAVYGTLSRILPLPT